jgi:hypothetical protein
VKWHWIKHIPQWLPCLMCHWCYKHLPCPVPHPTNSQHFMRHSHYPFFPLNWFCQHNTDPTFNLQCFWPLEELCPDEDNSLYNRGSNGIALANKQLPHEQHFDWLYHGAIEARWHHCLWKSTTLIWLNWNAVKEMIQM